LFIKLLSSENLRINLSGPKSESSLELSLERALGLFAPAAAFKRQGMILCRVGYKEFGVPSLLVPDNGAKN
jgi:hypothetical protein